MKTIILFDMPNKPTPKKKPWQQPREAFSRRHAKNEKFYNSQRWRKVAKSHKERHPLCVKCEVEGLVSAVEYTDHIVRIEDGGDPYSDDNLQSLCKFHHNQKSGREAHGYKEGYGVKTPKEK